MHIVSTDADSHWLSEFTLALLTLAKVTQVLAILTEYYDIVLTKIDYINVSLTVKVYVLWFLELTWTIMITKCSDKVQVRVNQSSCFATLPAACPMTPIPHTHSITSSHYHTCTLIKR